ncbi:MAG: aspartate/glutamate racemase family protein [Oleiphilaceae bacterium]
MNQKVREQLGGLHSAKIILYSVDFAEIESLQHKENRDETAKTLISAAQSVEAGGADILLVCTNTMHKVAP